MKPSNNDNQLDKLIAESVGREGLSFDFDKWKQGHRNEAQQFESQTKTMGTNQSSPLKIWRTIMKSLFAKLTTAAAVFIVITLGVFGIITNGAKTAWAIEQTIEAMENVDSIKLICKGVPPEDSSLVVDFVLWAKPNHDGTTSGTLRQEVSYDGDLFSIRLFDEELDISYRYKPKINTVFITSGNSLGLIDPWIGSKFFRGIKQEAEKHGLKLDASYKKDNETGKECIFVKISTSEPPKSWWLEIDSQTQLPVSIKQWNNSSNFEGRPDFEIDELFYNPELPEGIFEFEIPEGATVVDQRNEGIEKGR